MLLVFYVTGHGFGHATRSLAVVERILSERPGTRVIIRSSVPEQFLRLTAPVGLEIQALQADTGMVQVDSLEIDEAGTARAAAEFYRTFDQRVAAEASLLERLDVSAVIGDIPPLAFAAARAASRPSVAIANFTWDWIYRAYPDFERAAAGVIETIASAYATATRTLRLPFAGGFESMAPTIRDIPLIARQSRLGKARARVALGLSNDRPIVLGSFGGHQTAIPYDDIADRCRITLVVTDHESRQSGESLRRFTARDLADRGLRYEDLVAAADIVVSKPGYGIVSECIANDSALLYTSRGHFAENDVLVDAMARVMRCRYLEQEAVRAGTWQEAIDALLEQPMPTERMETNGASVAAREILDVATQA